MRRVLAAAESGFHHGKAALEEEYQKAAKHDPGKVCAIEALLAVCATPSSVSLPVVAT
jgi:hypothetical protein